MHAYVFTDARLAKRAGQFAWLSVDTENETNEAFLKKFPMEGVPTFLIVDAKTEKPVVQWYGTLTVEQLQKLLDDGRQSVARKAGGAGADAMLMEADRLNAEKKRAEAIKAYQDAIEAGGPNWPRRVRAIESLVVNAQIGNRAVCAKTAQQYAPHIRRGQSFANIVGTGFGCALSADSQTSPWRQQAIEALLPLAREAVKLPQVLGDDRAQIYSFLVDYAESKKDPEAVKEVATAWWAFLEDEAKRAPNPEARASLDAWRIGAARALKNPNLAIPRIEQSERDLPNDYNPPARLAVLYNDAGRYDDALAAAGRALAKSYGPRKIGVYQTKAAILETKGDQAGVRQTLQEAIRYAETLPESQNGPRFVQGLKARLAKLRASAN